MCASPRRARPRTLDGEDIYRLRYVADPQVSPDGSQVAYVVAWVDPDDRTRYRSQLMLVPFDASSPPRPLTSGRQRDNAPRWAPDGQSIAFVSNRDDDRAQLFLLPLSGGEARQLTRLERGVGSPVWSPRGDRLAFAAAVDVADIASQEGQPDDRGKQPRLRLVTRVRYKADGEGFREATRKHLFVLDIQDGEPRQVTDGDWDDADPAWSPDGQWLAFTSSRERDRDLTLLNDVWVVSARGGRARRITRHDGQAALPSFAPDGRSIAYLGHARAWTYGARTELMCASLDGRQIRSISGDFAYEVENAANSDARDVFAPSSPRWLADGRGVLALTSRQGRVELLQFRLDGAPPKTIVGGEREIAAFSVSQDGRRVACAISDPLHPYEVVVHANGVEQQITTENRSLLDQVNLASAETFQTTSSDGETVHGWLMRPPGRRRGQRPLILEIHGGPETMYAWTFMHEFQVLAAHGYGVLYTNPRGSKGYGEAFNARIAADWGNQDAADCLAAVDAVERLSWVDRERIGVTGGSYGGYMTSWLVGHTHRFRAAVSQRGLYNWTSFYGTSDIGPWFGDYVLGGPVHERADLYRDRSPITYAPAIRTPLLLIHSEMDLRCPIEQAEQLFVRLRRIGRADTELVRFPEESHGLSRGGRPDRRVERLRRMLGWFERYMPAQ